MIIIAGTIELDPDRRDEALVAAQPHIDGALTQQGCEAYTWSADLNSPGRVEVFERLPERFSGKGLNFRFTAPAEVWESVAAGETDPITAGLRGVIKVRGDMRFLMENADAVKLLIDLYGSQVDTEWPQGKPPY